MITAEHVMWKGVQDELYIQHHIHHTRIPNHTNMVLWILQRKVNKYGNNRRKLLRKCMGMYAKHNPTRTKTKKKNRIRRNTTTTNNNSYNRCIRMTKYVYRSNTRTFEKLPKYIYQRRNGWFEIRKRIGGVLLYWGSFPTLEEALLYRAYYIGKDWKVNPRFKANKHIVHRNNHYMIVKEQNGKRECYGTFRDITTARQERDVCVACNWDYNEIVEFED